MTSSKLPMLAVRIERFPIAGHFTISRGAKTEAITVVAEVSRSGLTGRGECVPYARYGETPEATLRALKAMTLPATNTSANTGNTSGNTGKIVTPPETTVGKGGAQNNDNLPVVQNKPIPTDSNLIGKIGNGGSNSTQPSGNQPNTAPSLPPGKIVTLPAPTKVRPIMAPSARS